MTNCIKLSFYLLCFHLQVGQILGQTKALLQLKVDHWLGQPDSISGDPLYGHVFDYWSKERTYYFRAVYLNARGDTLTVEQIKLHPTGQVWKTDAKQTLMDFYLDFTAEDSARLVQQSPTGVNHAWMRTYHEGVLQNKDRIWMHPIRQNQYRATEVAPFPEVKFSMRENQGWGGSLTIMDGWGLFQGTVRNSYHMMGEETRTYGFASLRCKKITAEGVHSSLGMSTVTYYFNPVYGFTEMLYEFYDKTRLDLVLEAVDGF
jgi:hypothetical protein